MLFFLVGDFFFDWPFKEEWIYKYLSRIYFIEGILIKRRRFSNWFHLLHHVEGLGTNISGGIFTLLRDSTYSYLFFPAPWYFESWTRFGHHGFMAQVLQAVQQSGWILGSFCFQIWRRTAVFCYTFLGMLVLSLLTKKWSPDMNCKHGPSLVYVGWLTISISKGCMKKRILKSPTWGFR